MKRGSIAAVLAAAVLLAACGDDDSDGGGGSAASITPAATTPGATTSSTPESSAPVVDMTDRLEFLPKTITVRAGQRVKWRNVGKVAHTVTTTPAKVADRDNVEVPAAAKDFDSGFIGDGEDYERAFTEPGTYRYVCIPHEGANMVGTVVVDG